MKINCEMCNSELKDAGGLLFSPPENRMTEKIHLCRDCYKVVKRVILSKKYRESDVG